MLEFVTRLLASEAVLGLIAPYGIFAVVVAVWRIDVHGHHAVQRTADRPIDHSKS